MIGAIKGYEIHQIHTGDAWKLCDFMVANAERFKRYFPITLSQNLNPTLSQLFVEKKVKQGKAQEEFLFTLKDMETRELVGILYIKELDWIKKQGELAYCIGYAYERKGLTSNTVQFLSKYAFETLGLKTLQIIAHKNNLPSIGVAKKCGYTWIETLKNEFTPPGEQPLDMELYEKYDEG